MNERHLARTAVAVVAGLLTCAVAARAAAGDSHGHAAPAPAAPAATPAAAHAPAVSVSAADAVKKLADGNARFTAAAAKRPNQDQARLCDTFANGQHPYAAILSCADSRVPPEIVLDAGIGDLFVVRVAGNVADVDEIGTLEYGVEHLGINAILVMGHTKCGAVTAVVEKAHVTKNIEKLVDNIVPAAEDARKAFPQLSGSQLVGKAIEMNVRRQMADLVANSDVVRDRVKAGTLKIVGGVYDLHTGEVNWIEALSPSAVAAAPTSPRQELLTPAPKFEGHAAPAKAAAPEKADTHAPAAKDGHSAAPKHSVPDGDTHDDAHAPTDKHSKAGTADQHAATQPAKKENFVALGGLLAGGCCVSYGVLHFMKGKPASAAAEETPEAGDSTPAKA